MKTDIAEGSQYNGIPWIITIFNTLAVPIRVDHISADVYFKQSLRYKVTFIRGLAEYECHSTTTYGHLQDLYDEDNTKNWTDHQISANGKKTFLGIIEPMIGSGYRSNSTTCLELYPFSCCFASLQTAYICQLNDVECPSQGLNLPYIEIEFYSNITISINDTFADTITYNQPFFPLYVTPQEVITGEELCCNDLLFYPTFEPTANPTITTTKRITTKSTTTSVSVNPTSDPQNPTNETKHNDQSSNLHILTYAVVVLIVLIAIGFLVCGVVLFAKKQNKMNQNEELLMEKLNAEPGRIQTDAYRLLEQWSLEQYANVLIDRKGYDDITEWKDITINDLQNMGLKEGHCKKFVKKVNETINDENEEIQQPEGQIYTNQ